MIVEVFKTNVEEGYHATLLVAAIHHRFPTVNANFDLDDCDRVLRVKSAADNFYPEPIIQLLEVFGFRAEILSDEIPDAIYNSSNPARPVQPYRYRMLDN